MLRYWYPSNTRRKGEIGHLVKRSNPGKALCYEYLLSGGIWRDKPIPGYTLCEKCKAQRKKLKPAVNLDWAKIRPDSREFIEELSPEGKLIVLAARQAAREQGR